MHPPTQPTRPCTRPSTNQSTNQPTNQSINQPASFFIWAMEPHNLRPPTNPPMHPPTQTTNQPTNQSINQPSNLLITLAPGSHHGAPLERPAGAPLKRPAAATTASLTAAKMKKLLEGCLCVCVCVCVWMTRALVHPLIAELAGLTSVPLITSRFRMYPFANV